MPSLVLHVILLLLSQWDKVRIFGHATPSLEEYVPLDEQLLPPPTVQLGDTWDFWGVQGPHNI